ncbi:hypothetical protein DL96DRAFT_1626754 [Flagelloscypha sp. PMI_526]|nr:hypothetical protein DL96DRAFT_1626754 [Flagelloscypha sp. PMI_526]
MASESGFTLETVVIPDHSVSFTYLDSGYLESNSYTAIFFIHGYNYHASICEPLLPLAPAHNLRFIALNRRGYNGTTSYTPSEIQELDNPTSDKVEWIRKQGHYLVLAINALIVKLGLSEKGGFALCGWSLGTVFSLGILDAMHSDMLEKETKERLRKFVRCIILYDPSARTFGIPLPPDQTAYYPLSQLTNSDEENTRVFGEWISSYFQHDETHPHAFSKLNDSSPPTTLQPTLSEASTSTKLRLSQPTPTTSLSELHAIEQRARPGLTGLASLRETYFESRMTLGKEVKKYVIYGSMSAWTCVWPAWWLKIEGKDKGIVVRRMQGANHLMTWDKPNEFLAHVRWCLDESETEGKSFLKNSSS